MYRSIFETDHELFRESAREIIDREIAPNVAKWEAAGVVDKEMFHKAGQAGLLGMEVPEVHGGGGVADFRFNAVISEELMRGGVRRRRPNGGSPTMEEPTEITKEIIGRSLGL